MQKTFQLTLRHDSGSVVIQTKADSLQSAKQKILTAEGAPESAVTTWRIVPTARQIAKTKNLMRGL